MDYKKLRKEFKELLNNITNKEINSWLKFDNKRLKQENGKNTYCK